jgi:arsenate reductase (thioredoxin)
MKTLLSQIKRKSAASIDYQSVVHKIFLINISLKNEITINMNPVKVLFVCVHNSARSQMAEAFLNHLGNGQFIAESAGLESGILNPIVVDAMKLDGIDISGNKTKIINSIISSGKIFDYVITVCDETNAEKCPVVPGSGARLHWSFDDPSALNGSYVEKLNQTLLIMYQIKTKIENWIIEIKTQIKLQEPK